MLPTPSTSHINTDRIYEPAEDSFLLLDTLSSRSEVEFLKKRFSRPATDELSPSPSPLILEVGTGSGVVLAFLTANAKEIFGRADILSLGTDINRFACQATQQTVLQACREGSTYWANERLKKAKHTYHHPLGVLNADLATPIRPGIVDVLIFNPPYVPTSELPVPSIVGPQDDREAPSSVSSTFEYDSHLLALSYAGGMDGLEVTNRLLDQIPRVLSRERGLAYVLLCKQNKPEEVMRRIRQWGPAWAVTLVGESGKTGGWEKLQVIRIYSMQGSGS